MNQFEYRQADRKKAKIRLGLSGPSGSGKTKSALLIAYGLCGDWRKIAVIDTENYSADLFGHLGPFNVVPLSMPYSPDRYAAAIKYCESKGAEVIIVDCISHEWEGPGGMLEIADNITQQSINKNSFSSWLKGNPIHNKFIYAILYSSCHIITTCRRKQDYEVTKDDRGKMQVAKIGLKEITRDGFEYELTTNLTLDMNHYASASKDRTELFMDKEPFIPTIETGQMIAEWCNAGTDPAEEIETGIQHINNCNSVEELSLLKTITPPYVLSSKEWRAAAIKRHSELKS